MISFSTFVTHGTGDSSSDHSAMAVFVKSVVLVGIAELFDKTWFMGLLMALKYDKVTVFMGSFVALLLHCFLAAACGLAFAKLLPQHVLHYMAAGLFAFFACLYAWDCYQADPEGDAIASGREEAEDSVNIEKPQEIEKDSENPSQASQQELIKEANQINIKTSSQYGTIESKPKGPSKWLVFGKCFLAVFIAEWGDRTQFAMVGQHASQPLLPVFWGSVAAFFLLTLSAVMVAFVLDKQRLSERLVHGVGAAAFFVFAVLALKDALDDHPVGTK